MTFTDLLNKQRELQTHSQQQPMSLSQIRLAQKLELNEVLEEIKWGLEGDDNILPIAWWHRDEKPKGKRTKLIEELADLLCFLLLEQLHHDANGELDIESLERYWDKPWKSPDQMARDAGIVFEGYYYELLNAITDSFSSDKNAKSDDCAGIINFTFLCAFLGVSRAEIEQAYEGVYQKNVERWAAAP